MQEFSIARAMTILSFCFLSLPAYADTIQLTNGDRLSGEILSKDGKTITLKTDYAGKVKIRWRDVAHIQTDHPVSILLEDDSILNGVLVPTETGEVIIRFDDPTRTVTVDLDKLSYINPPPEVSQNVLVITGGANVGITTISGNNDTKNIHIDSELIARTRDNRFTVGVVANRSTDAGVLSISNNRGHFQYDHFLDNKRYAYSNLSVENDRFKDLRLRTSLGIGSGYQVFESTDLKLSVEGGLNHVSEDYWIKEDKRFPSVRWSMKYDETFFQKLTAFHEQEALISLKNAQDMLIRTKTGLRFPLSRQLVGTLQYDIDWDRNPVPGAVGMDRTLLLNMGYRWQ